MGAMPAGLVTPIFNELVLQRKMIFVSPCVAIPFGICLTSEEVNGRHSSVSVSFLDQFPTAMNATRTQQSTKK